MAEHVACVALVQTRKLIPPILFQQRRSWNGSIYCSHILIEVLKYFSYPPSWSHKSDWALRSWFATLCNSFVAQGGEPPDVAFRYLCFWATRSIILWLQPTQIQQRIGGALKKTPRSPGVPPTTTELTRAPYEPKFGSFCSVSRKQVKHTALTLFLVVGLGFFKSNGQPLFNRYQAGYFP